jgi:cysteine desulfurase / selenocysteine lyase
LIFGLKNYKKDFPDLNGYVYLDNACMSLKPNSVIREVTKYYENYPACGGRSGHSLSNKVDELVHASRVELKTFIGASSEKEIIFSKNTTESLNLVASSFKWKKGKSIVTSDKEHTSNLLPWMRAAKDHGLKRFILTSKEDNSFSMDRYEKTMNDDVQVVALGHASNLDGSTIPAKEIIDKAHEHGAVVVLDSAQFIPHHPVDVKKLGVDFLAFSGHKMCGPTGTGILYGKEENLNNLEPFLMGGETIKNSWHDKYELEDLPERFEAGLQDYSGILGLRTAVKYLKNVGMKEIEKKNIKLNKINSEGVENLGGTILGPRNHSLRGGIINFMFKDIDSHKIGLMLDSSAKIAVRTGMHCNHSWFNARNLKGSVRASSYFYNTEEECDFFINKLKNVIKVLK